MQITFTADTGFIMRPLTAPALLPAINAFIPHKGLFSVIIDAIKSVNISSNGKYNPDDRDLCMIVCPRPAHGALKFNGSRKGRVFFTERYRALSHGLKSDACRMPLVKPQLSNFIDFGKDDEDDCDSLFFITLYYKRN